MKATELLLSFDYKLGFFGSVFGWMVCLTRKHNWELRKHWKLINEASVGCPRCMAVQFLEDVPDDWDGQYASRRVDPILTAIRLCPLVGIIFLVSFVLIKVF